MKHLTVRLLLAGFVLSLPGCVIVQGSYDSEARRSCDDIANVEDRLTCERAVRDAERQRRTGARREN
ncbi:MAG: hypothetical protein AAGJ32_03740 [Pseudomonadota bacterium]